MRSQNAAKAWSGRIARLRDCSRRAFAVAVPCGMAALAACSVGPAPTIAPPSPVALAPLPAELKGLGTAEVVALLGSPDFRRSEPPAELWQYRNADCILDVFLYGDSGGYHVVDAETRERRRLAATGGGCSASPGSFVRRSRQNRL